MLRIESILNDFPLRASSNRTWVDRQLNWCQLI